MSTDSEWTELAEQLEREKSILQQRLKDQTDALLSRALTAERERDELAWEVTEATMAAQAAEASLDHVHTSIVEYLDLADGVDLPTALAAIGAVTDGRDAHVHTLDHVLEELHAALGGLPEDATLATFPAALEQVAHLRDELACARQHLNDYNERCIELTSRVGREEALVAEVASLRAQLARAKPESEDRCTRCGNQGISHQSSCVAMTAGGRAPKQLERPVPEFESEADAYLAGYNDTLRQAAGGNHTVGGVCGHCSEAGHSTAQCPNKE